MIFQLKQITAAAMTVAFLGACASAPKASISPTANPNDEIRLMESDIQSGYDKQYDVLAYSDFTKSQKELDKAKEEIKDGEDQGDVIDTLSKSRGYYNRATESAEKFAGKVDGVLNARQAALAAGARNFPKEKDTLNDLDDDLRSEVDDINDMDAEDFSKLQQNYMKLEVTSTQTSLLGKARAQIDGAVRGGADDNTPKTLALAKKDLINAENMIAANVRNSEGYSSAVTKANASARLLGATLAASQRDGKVLPESVALEIVAKDKTLNLLSEQLGSTQSELSSSQEMSRNQQATLSTQKGLIELNNAIKTASKDFSKDEAEVYRQGDKLLIRLKGMKFPSGRSELPGDSMALLERVKGVAQGLNASSVVVEGHTDAVGAAAANKELSQKRAEAVAKYFSSNGLSDDAIQAVGYGFEKPLATNKTKDGRAKNRRVDVIITPTFQAKAKSNTASPSAQ